MGSRGAAATQSLHLMLVATLTLAAATFMSTAEAGCSSSMAQQLVNSTSRGFRVPEGGEDGIYMGSVEVDEQGVEQYRVKYLGKGNATLDAYGGWSNNNVNVSRPGGLGRKLLQQDSGVQCEFTFLTATEVYIAHAQLASYFGPDGATVEARSRLAVVYGCTRAYFCNYRYYDFFTTADRIWVDALAINEACGDVTGGYYAREYTLNIGSGRTHRDSSYCYF